MIRNQNPSILSYTSWTAAVLIVIAGALGAQSPRVRIPHPATALPSQFVLDMSQAIAWDVSPSGELLVLSANGGTAIYGDGDAAMDRAFGAGGWSPYELPVTGAGYFLDYGVQAPTGGIGIGWGGDPTLSPCCTATPGAFGVPGLWGTTTRQTICSVCHPSRFGTIPIFLVNQPAFMGPPGHGMTFNVIRVQI